MKRGAWIWVTRWQDFQHYAPERDRAPAWVKDYTKQMNDARYLRLTDRQRALLSDVRRSFAMTFGRLPGDSRTITRYRHRQTRDNDLAALSDAGFIEFISRPVLERRLDLLYSSPRARVEVEVEREKEVPHAADAAAGARKRGKAKPTSYERAATFVRNAGYQLAPVDFLAELAEYELTPDQRHDLEQLRSSLNGTT